jgi:hypothetical protein
LYGFIVGSALSLVWCIVLLALFISFQIPNSSLFPEIDFASRCIASKIPDHSSSVGRLLFPLGNATSGVVQDRLERTRFFVGAGKKLGDRVPHVTIATEEAVTNKLVKGEMYN